MVAALLAVALLVAWRERFPERCHWRGLGMVALGVVPELFFGVRKRQVGTLFENVVVGEGRGATRG